MDTFNSNQKIIFEEDEENTKKIQKEEDSQLKPKKVHFSDSFDMDFNDINTPAKEKPVKVYDDFATPKNYVLPGTKAQSVYKCQYVTPKNKVQPKIQCSVDMKAYLRTPIDKLGPPLDKEKKKSVSKSFPILLGEPVDHTFKKIHVNGVEYVILNELGKGGSSEVFQCYNTQTKSCRAIKCVSLSNPDSASGFINEVQVLKTLQNCNRIVKLYDL